MAAAAAVSNAGVPAVSVSLWKATTSADGGLPSSLLQDGLGAGRLEVVADEPAGAQRARNLRSERQSDGDQHGPGDDDESCAAHDEAAESIEGSHASSSYARPALAVVDVGFREPRVC